MHTDATDEAQLLAHHHRLHGEEVDVLCGGGAGVSRVRVRRKQPPTAVAPSSQLTGEEMKSRSRTSMMKTALSASFAMSCHSVTWLRP